MPSTAVATTAAVAAHADDGFSPHDPASAVAAQYEHAAAHLDAYAGCRRYRGCDSFADHANLSHCFVRPDDASWNVHAAYCGICREEAVVVRRLLDDGRSTPDIRAEIVDRFPPRNSEDSGARRGRERGLEDVGVRQKRREGATTDAEAMTTTTAGSDGPFPDGLARVWGRAGRVRTR